MWRCALAGRRLLPITQGNVLPGREKVRLHCKSDTPTPLTPSTPTPTAAMSEIEAVHPLHHFEDEPRFQLDNL